MTQPETTEKAEAIQPPPKWIAIAAFILSLFAIVLPPVALGGIVCGHAALYRIQRGTASGKGVAIVALIISYIMLVPAIIVLLFMRGNSG